MINLFFLKREEEVMYIDYVREISQRLVNDKDLLNYYKPNHSIYQTSVLKSDTLLGIILGLCILFLKFVSL